MGTIYRPKYKDPDGTVKESKVYWIKYYRHGKPYRESTKSHKLADARRILKKREGEIAEGKIPGIRVDRVTFDELMEDVALNYKTNSFKSLERVELSIRHLKGYFEGMRAVEITTPHVDKYIDLRRKEGASNGSINRELNTLRKGFNLGAKSTPPKVQYVPYVPKLREDNIRKGFFEDHDFKTMRDHLPDHLKGFVTFAYKTGWRKAEISSLTWKQVDRQNGIVYLNPGETKNSEARTVYLDPELIEVIKNQWRGRDKITPYVFTARDGKNKIGDIRKAWRNACKDAGIPGKLFHDLRRTAVRNMVRAGIPERVAMMVSGHKTRSIFDRYNIVNDDDLRSAMQRYSDYIDGQRKSGMGKVSGKVADIESARGKVSN